MPDVLVLAGTAEAHALSERLTRMSLETVVSLTGVTGKHSEYHGLLRIGRYGGVDGLTRYLRETGFAAVIDATHPFAARMSANAVQAAAQAGVPCLRLTRPSWEAGDADIWHSVKYLRSAIEVIPNDGRVFAATGYGSFETFAAETRFWTLLRLIIPPADQNMARGALLIARPPFDEQAEMQLLRTHEITHVICKNSGGSGGRNKLHAAAALGLPVIMVDRPVLPECTAQFSDVDAVCDWLTANVVFSA